MWGENVGQNLEVENLWIFLREILYMYIYLYMCVYIYIYILYAYNMGTWMAY